MVEWLHGVRTRVGVDRLRRSASSLRADRRPVAAGADVPRRRVAEQRHATRSSSSGPETEPVTTPRPTPGRRPARRGGAPTRTPGRELRRVPVLLVVGACIAIAIALGLSGADNTIAAAVPTVAEPDTVSTTWYCAEGTGAPGGRADETIIIANEGDTDA